MAVRVEGCMECSWGRRNESNGVESVNTMKENGRKRIAMILKSRNLFCTFVARNMERRRTV